MKTGPPIGSPAGLSLSDRVDQGQKISLDRPNSISVSGANATVTTAWVSFQAALYDGQTAKALSQSQSATAEAESLYLDLHASGIGVYLINRKSAVEPIILKD